jgi:hypothetical protein
MKQRKLEKKKKKGRGRRRAELRVIPFHFSFGPDSRCEETAEEFVDEKGRETQRYGEAPH